MKTIRIISTSILLQISQSTFVHLNITPSPQPGAKPIINASVLGEPPRDKEELRAIAEVVLEHLDALAAADVTPRRIVLPRQD